MKTIYQNCILFLILEVLILILLIWLIPNCIILTISVILFFIIGLILLELHNNSIQQILKKLPASQTSKISLSKIIDKLFSDLQEANKINNKHKETIQTLHRQIYQLSTLYDIGEEMNSTHDIKTIIKTILYTIHGSLGVAEGLIALTNSECTELQLAVSKGIDDELHSLHLDPETTQALIKHNKPIFIHKIENPILRTFFDNNANMLKAYHSHLWTPLITKGRLLGIISLNTKWTDEVYAKEELKTLQTIASNTAIAIVNARSFALVQENRKELEKQINRVNILYQLGQAFSQVLDIDELLTLVFERVIETMQAEAGSLWLQENDKLVCKVAHGGAGSKIVGLTIELGQGIAGKVAQTGIYEIIKDTQNDKGWDSSFDKKTGFITRSMLCVPLRAGGRTFGSVQIINKINRYELFDEEDLELLLAITNNAANAIENARLYKQVKEQERLERELEIANQIQSDLLPQEAPFFNSLTLAGMNKPAREVGGDFYDFIPVSDNLLGLVMADVSDKGVSAALFMTMCKALLWAQAKGRTSPKEVLTRLNTLLFELSRSESDMFVTVFYAILDTNNFRLRFSSAGHNPPFVYHPKTDNFTFLKLKGSALGVLEEVSLREEEIQLQKNDVLTLYTDGISEAINTDKKEFGLKRFENLIATHHNMSSQELIKLVFQRVESYAGEQPQFDDMTMVSLRILP